MTHAHWYFDFISPFAYLHWHSLKPLVAATGLQLQPRPILFAALLNHYGHRGPAEIPGKRRFSYRFVQWQAEQAGIEFRWPPAHPFNPLPALRLALALGNTSAVIEAIFGLIWRKGRLPDPAALTEVAAQFSDRPLAELLDDAAVKAQLRENTEAALAAGVFGVPTVQVEGELFWGNDSTAMLSAWLADRQLFQRGDYPRIDALPMAVSRV